MFKYSTTVYVVIPREEVTWVGRLKTLRKCTGFIIVPHHIETKATKAGDWKRRVEDLTPSGVEMTLFNLYEASALSPETIFKPSPRTSGETHIFRKRSSIFSEANTYFVILWRKIKHYQMWGANSLFDVLLSIKWKVAY